MLVVLHCVVGFVMGCSSKKKPHRFCYVNSCKSKLNLIIKPILFNNYYWSLICSAVMYQKHCQMFIYLFKEINNLDELRAYLTMKMLECHIFNFIVLFSEGFCHQALFTLTGVLISVWNELTLLKYAVMFWPLIKSDLLLVDVIFLRHKIIAYHATWADNKIFI